MGGVWEEVDVQGERLLHTLGNCNKAGAISDIFPSLEIVWIQFVKRTYYNQNDICDEYCC